MTEPKKYTLRFSTVEDHAKLMAFYAENPHDNVCERHSDLIKEMADKGSVVLVEEAATGKIVGASISYPIYVEQEGIEREKWMELGTTRMVLNGYPGLFDMMLGLQILRAYLVEPPEDRFVAQMESPMVRKMAQKLGWRPYTPSKELVEISDKTLDIAVGETYGYDNWYSGGEEMLPVVAKLLCAAIDKPCLENPKTGDKIELDISQSSFFKIFEDDIRALATKNLGDPDKQDYTKSVAKHRDAWMHRKFR
ncbi:MAG: hypothetical protein HY052_04400 [Proteobacteria bacterium]|nr:hypothetical protein [Pseudomonadota bacterium]